MDNYFTSATVWMIVWLLIGLVLTIGASLLTAQTLFPAFTARCAARAGRPVSAILIGVAVAAVAAVAVIALQKAGPAAQVPIFIILGSTVLMAIAGASGQVLRMAERSARDGEAPGSWPSLRRGTCVLTLTYLLPIAGWIIVLPLSLLCGLGCALLSFRSPKFVPLPDAYRVA